MEFNELGDINTEKRPIVSRLGCDAIERSEFSIEDAQIASFPHLFLGNSYFSRDFRTSPHRGCLSAILPGTLGSRNEIGIQNTGSSSRAVKVKARTCTDRWPATMQANAATRVHSRSIKIPPRKCLTSVDRFLVSTLTQSLGEHEDRFFP